MPSAPLLSLVDSLPEVACKILDQLSLPALASLSATCSSLRAATAKQPEHEWLARAHRYPAQHPLLQAPCARAFLAQQRRACAGTAPCTAAEKEYSDALCTGRCCWLLPPEAAAATVEAWA